MKFANSVSLLVAGAQLLDVALAAPAANYHVEYIKRDNEIVTKTVWTTINLPDVIVVVDENGNTISMSAPAATPAPEPVVEPAPAAAEPTPAPEPAPAAEPVPTIDPVPAPEPEAPAPPAEVPQEAPPAPPAPPAAPAPQPEPQPEAAPAPPPAPAPPSDIDSGFIDMGPSGYGISWSGYKGTIGASGCKTYEDADQEWAKLRSYSTVRIYGTDCDQPQNAIELAKKYNKKVILGIYYLDGRIPEQLKVIEDAASGNWGLVDAISIGNEDVHRGAMGVDGIYSAVAQSKEHLRQAGYQGPVIHIDSQAAILANPGLCSKAGGDYIAANTHPFFNSQTPAEKAGEFVQSQIELMRKCAESQGNGGVRVRVTETGWPTAGSANGDAIPGRDNQAKAIASIKSKISASTGLIVFSATDNKWMVDDPSTFGTEQHWGLY